MDVRAIYHVHQAVLCASAEGFLLHEGMQHWISSNRGMLMSGGGGGGKGGAGVVEAVIQLSNL